MFFLSLIIQVESGKSLSQVLCGNWTGGTIYKTPNGEKFNFSSIFVDHLSTPNFIETNIFDTNLLINLSSSDLSGNITIHENVFYFNFTQSAGPFVSTDIDLDIYGKIHCSIASYKCLRIIYMSPHGDIQTIILTKSILNSDKPWIIRNYKFVLTMALTILSPIVFQFISKKFLSCGVCQIPNIPHEVPKNEDKDLKNEEEVVTVEKSSEKIKTE